ncbi:MAG: hypothetical protein M1819_002660 [Sarea resinae]|nr:MAG: hypothetical protein M1819_002660 [Sarea resinae]
MPHAVDPKDDQAEQDELAIQRLLNETETGSFDIFSRDLVPGEKAQDAVDYEDIDDDDLAEEEEGPVSKSADIDGDIADDDLFGGLNDIEPEAEVAGLQNGADDEVDPYDDLFGDVPSSPTGAPDAPDAATQQGASTVDAGMSFEFEDEAAPDSSATATDPVPSQEVKETPKTTKPLFQDVDYTADEDDAQVREQHALFAMSDALLPPAPPENKEELLTSMWPKFERDTIPRFMDLIAPKKAHYLGKSPLKVPKPLHITKTNLEIAPEQERSFRSAGPASSSKAIRIAEAEAKGLILISDDESQEKSSEDEVEAKSIDADENIGGVTWSDLQMICDDWDIDITENIPNEKQNTRTGSFNDFDDLDDGDDWETAYGAPTAKKQKLIRSHEAQGTSLRRSIDEVATGHADEDVDSGRFPAKRQKVGHAINSLLAVPQFDFPSFDDPERATAKLAKAVTLDLNDPHLLIEILEPTSPIKKPRRLGGSFRRGANGALTKDLTQRYNVSNDEAYDLLKENHQSRVRSTLGNLTVEHSLPAVRLQWPYYKVKLEVREARSFHRPLMSFQTMGSPVVFSFPRHRKRKHLKGKDAQSVFQTTKDLSLGDNSSVLLLEYSEEYPTMMSNFGMGSRLINYYRRKNLEEHGRPKIDIGETAVLLPQDKSPFSIFGNIEPGQTMPTLYNGMYRAPIFQQSAKPTDFLVARNTTGVGGQSWYLRNIENLYVVGQEFPSVDVPGPHSRKVTTAAKNRLKMISYRKIRRTVPHRISVSAVTEHFPETTDMQNRQKMKEFMQFSKEHKEWEMRPGEPIPDEQALRSLIKPEDVCLLESMQVGQRHLQDAGYSKDDEEVEDEDGKEGQSMEQQLAPWHTTRNFLHATQGKAMLQLHGEGDPSGRGEAFSFIRTSMKGGFKAIGESVEDKLDAKKLKELGGHSYNVARQQKAYEDAIRRIWEAQKSNLSSAVEHSDTDMDDDHHDEPEERFGGVGTPRSEAATPAAFSRRDDDTASQMSKFSTASQSGKVLRINRRRLVPKEGLKLEEDVIKDPRVIRMYLKRRHAIEAENLKLSELKPTGDAERDRRSQKLLEEELARLERNKDRRLARDKQKGLLSNGIGKSPSSPGSPATINPKSVGTQRKCANCGQVGHIKTNKKLCPMLNGTMKQEDGFTNTGFGSLGSSSAS